MVSKDFFMRVNQEYGVKLTEVPSNLDIVFTAKSSFQLLQDEQTKQIYILKIFPSISFSLTPPETYFKGLGYFVQHVTLEGIPLVNYLPTIQGTRHMGHQGKYYVLYPFIEGHSYTGSNDELKDTAQVHAKMNKALEEMDPKQVDFIKRKIRNIFLRNGDLPTLFQEAETKIKSNNENESIAKLKLVLPLVRDQVEIIDENLYRSLPAGVSHKDVWPANVIYEEGKVTAILDPDEMMYIPRARDVMYSILCFATYAPDGKITAPDMMKAKAYLTAYLNQSDLTDEEIKLFPKVAVRVWTEDFLHFVLNSDLSIDPLPNLESRVAHITNAVESQGKFNF